jgi:DNA replication protein DnaC
VPICGLQAPDLRRTGIRPCLTGQRRASVQSLLPRCQRGSIIVTGNLRSSEGIGAFASGRPTGVMLDRITHQFRILKLIGDSVRLEHRKRQLRHDWQPPPI